MAKRLKSGLIAWRYLTPKTRNSEIRKYGSKEAAQKARRQLPTQKLKPRSVKRLVAKYGSVANATAVRRQVAAKRVIEKSSVVRIPEPPQSPPVVYDEEEVSHDGEEWNPNYVWTPSVEQVVEWRTRTKDWNNPNDRMTKEEWRLLVEAYTEEDIEMEDRRLWEGYKEPK